MTTYRTTIVHTTPNPTTEQLTTITTALDGAPIVTADPATGITITHTVTANSITDALNTAAYNAGDALAKAGLGAPGGPVSVTVSEAAWHTAQTVAPGMPGTVNITDIASILNVSQQRASQLADDPTFPAPLNPGARPRLWDETAIRAFAKRPRRPGRPRKQH